MSTNRRKEALVGELREGLLLCDGAMGTILSAEGHSAGRSLDAMNVEQPDVVRAAHRAYLDAGARTLETNTFQGTRPSLDRYGLGDQTAAYNRAAAELAREVAGEQAYVAGCIGPTGRLLEPYGDLEEAAASAGYEEQTQVLAEAGVELFIVETFAALEELLLAVRAAAVIGLPVAASMAFDPNGHTVFGVTPQRAAAELEAAGAQVVGANCGTVSPEEMVAILEGFRGATSLPLIAQPNAGRPERTETGVVFRETPEGLAPWAERFRGLGATVIGGCCGTTPAHIREIGRRLGKV